MDVYDRNDWQMRELDSYGTYSLDWPENVFGEELEDGPETSTKTDSADDGDAQMADPADEETEDNDVAQAGQQ